MVREIKFNKIAPTFMSKALTAIVKNEAQESGRRFGPSKQVLDALSTSGDIRSAIMGLEFLAANGDLPNMGFAQPIKARQRKKPEDRGLNAEEKSIIAAVTQRESSYGIFHAVGKVVYNKRYGDDAGDPYFPTPVRPPLPELPYHSRAVRNDDPYVPESARKFAQHSAIMSSMRSPVTRPKSQASARRGTTSRREGQRVREGRSSSERQLGRVT